MTTTAVTDAPLEMIIEGKEGGGGDFGVSWITVVLVQQFDKHVDRCTSSKLQHQPAIAYMNYQSSV